VNDAQSFGVSVLLLSAAVLAAALSSRLTERLRLPAPALFLVVAAVASDLVPALARTPLVVDERLVTTALVLILFDGGLQIGWREFRASVGVIAWVGVVGTLLTALALAACAHAVFGFDWTLALALGAALAPTDPATVFAVLGRREVSGPTGTILKGEAGLNDPVGIALMVALLGAGGVGSAALAQGTTIFVEQLVIGAIVGLAGGWLLVRLMCGVPLPNEALYSLRAVAFAGLVYGVADVLHGSGFLAVLLTGVVAGDARAPYKHEIERFASGLSSLAEIVAFTVLGLTIDLHDLVTSHAIWLGLGLALLLGVLIRPIILAGLLARSRLARGERLFLLFAGLKGAVPILLGTFVLEAGVTGGHRVYDVIFVVVLVSVVIQGGLVPTMARVWRVPMRNTEPEPWALGMRFRSEPRALQRYFVGEGSPAEGTSIGDLDLGEDAWVSMVSRHGEMVGVHGGTRLHAGDEVLLIGNATEQVSGLFTPRAPDE
jgi:cell volume regulation protein A